MLKNSDKKMNGLIIYSTIWMNLNSIKLNARSILYDCIKL